ncbi:unnamed protein product [Lactuca virosa]|uniref:Uncharacterized protein n=1 Tax=Lactuca virosa TaxID=75947 RepID=A0AAU9PAZ6_9ASTR|nr:unnamed protein product [Lactuca virosa]
MRRLLPSLKPPRDTPTPRGSMLMSTLHLRFLPVSCLVHVLCFLLSLSSLLTTNPLAPITIDALTPSSLYAGDEGPGHLASLCRNVEQDALMAHIYPHDGNWKESSQGLLVTINYTRALLNHHYNERVKQVVLDRMKKGNILHM